MPLLSCGPSFGSIFAKKNYYNFLDASLVGVDEDNPLYALAQNPSSYYNRVDYFDKQKEKLNIEEWKSFFQNKLTSKQLKQLFYSGEDFIKEYELNYKLLIKNPAFNTYIYFLDRQKQNAFAEDTNKQNNKALSQEAMEYFSTEKSDFLKLRYLFLAMRLEHYAGNYQETLNLYKTYHPALENVHSIVGEWIDALRAGALQHLGKRIQANLLYGQILKNNKTNAHLGYYDFKIKNNPEWQELFSKLKTPQDKALFYFMRSLKWEGSPIMEHREIAHIAPNSIWFDRLSYMLMQDFQEQWYAYETNSNKKSKYAQANLKSLEQKSQYFLETLKQLKKPSFFSFYSKAYLGILEHHSLHLEELKHLESIASNPKEKNLVAVLGYLDESNHVAKTTQERLYSHLKKLYPKVNPSLQEALFSYTALKSIALYPQMSAERFYSKLEADSSGLSSYYSSIDHVSANYYEAFVEKKNRSFYENKIFKKTMSSMRKGSVAEILALLSMRDGHFQKAQKYLGQVPKLDRETPYNPFNVSLSGNNRKIKSTKSYKQRKLLQILLKIEENLKKNPHSAMDHFLYATGRYNTTWFGNFPTSSATYRNTSHISKDESLVIEKNLNEIEEEYILALKYAKKSNFKAKIAYQILKVKFAKMNLNEIQKEGYFYMPSFGTGYDEDEMKKLILKSKDFSEAVEAYEETYSNTSYGQEIIRNCVTFRYL